MTIKQLVVGAIGMGVVAATYVMDRKLDREVDIEDISAYRWEMYEMEEMKRKAQAEEPEAGADHL